MKNTDYETAIALQLLCIDFIHYQKVKKFDDLCGGGDYFFIDDDALFNLALDLLGVPPETEPVETENGPVYEFCRDWLREEWSEVLSSGQFSKVLPFPAWVSDQLSRLN